MSSVLSIEKWTLLEFNLEFHYLRTLYLQDLWGFSVYIANINQHWNLNYARTSSSFHSRAFNKLAKELLLFHKTDVRKCLRVLCR